MRPPSSPPKVAVRALEDSDGEGETADSALPEGSSPPPQRPQELIQAHFDNISTASDTQVRATGCSFQRDRGETNAARADTNANTELGRDEGAGDYTCTCSTKRIVPEYDDPEEHDDLEEHDNPEEHDDPELAKSEGALVRSKGKEVARERPASNISQCLPSPHTLAAGKMIDVALNRPRSGIPYSGVPPGFVNRRQSTLDIIRGPLVAKAKTAAQAATTTACAVSPVVPNPGVRPDFINPHARRPSILANYRRRAELQKEKDAAAAAGAAKPTGEGSKSTKSPGGSEEKPKDEAETASAASLSRNPDSGNPQQPLLDGPPGPSAHFDDNLQFHEDRRGARRRVKDRWQRIKNWVRREWGVRKRKG
ncbi:hypothetical protein B0T18DRAFT_45416 [Schizothecium vesticola]|uniref:Uncharacterized protein n=1 Tax=Schizothecium vesticola TaxID=314040 RepID=A0AA40FBX1_9PEZI|nr:hypothetical protein B0T18DRAFT_45416 [Schizothecium vesticola]